MSNPASHDHETAVTWIRLCTSSSARASRGGCGNQGTGGCETIHPNSVILLLHFLSLRETCAPEHALLMSQCSQCTPNAEKSAVMMVQMCPADSQLSGGHCDVVRSVQHLEPFLRITEALGMPFLMLSRCVLVPLYDGCVPETLLKPEVFLLSGFS